MVTYPLTFPPATKVQGQAGIVADLDAAYNSLQALAGVNVTDSQWAGGADPGGVLDSTAAFAAAITGAGAGTVYVPPGTYKISTGPLTLTAGTRITGAGASATTLTTSAGGLFSFSGAVRGAEIDHMALDVTGGDVFAGANVGRGHFHHLVITQRSAGFSVWNASACTSYLENLWENLSYTLTTASRTVPAWNFTSTANDAFNANVWRGIVANNNGPDAAQYQWLLQCNGAGNTFQNNKLVDITFENPLGGAIKILSGQQTIIENCRTWDLSTNVSAPLINIGTDPTSLVGPAGTVIRDCGRTFGALNGSGVSQDITLDSGCSQTVIDNLSVYAPASKPYVNLNGSQGTSFVNAPGNLTLSGTSGATWTLPGGEGMAFPSDQGLIAWSYDPAIPSNGSAPASGTIQLVKLIIRNACTVTNVLANVSGAGATLTAGQNLAGLYNSAGTLLSATADQSGSWTSTGLKTMALSAAQAVQPGAYWVALLSVGTTPPTFARGSGLAGAGGMFNAGLTAATYRFATGPAAQTSLPSITMGSNAQAAVSFWVAVS